MVKRFLITTALEETWCDDVPILFLGEWCRRYDRKQKWRNLDAEVVPYHWDDREKLHRDYLYLQEVYDKFLAELREHLNALHGVDHSLRYWRILIGPWLGYFIQMLFDRWTMLQQAVKDYEITGSRVISRNGCSFVPNDMEDFIRDFVTDEWNEAICGELLECMGVPVVRVAGRSEAQPSRPKNCGIRVGFKQKIKRTLTRAVSHLSGMVCSETEYFFISTYLPVKQDLSLQLKLGQLPKRWSQSTVPHCPVDRAAREQRLAFPGEAGNFTIIARAMIQRHIPTAYQECYMDLVVATKKLTWPNRPKAIFTSVSWESDDVFKAWAADKVADGALLLLGQHGGSYGMALWGFTEDHQVAISDRFLTWGWRQAEQQKVTPIGNLKGFGKTQGIDKNGMALLVEMAVPRTSYHMYSIPVAHQWLNYFDDQCRFVKALPPDLREQLLVRLYLHDYGWCQRQRWKDRFPSIRLDDGHQPIASLISKSRLYISSYNATTYLESLSLNIPTIMFWNPEHWELRDSAIPAFEKLKSVGIFHETPESAAHQMTRVWNDIDAWWQNEATQRVRREFCEIYAHLPEHPLDFLVNTFRDVVAEGALAKQL